MLNSTDFNTTKSNKYRLDIEYIPNISFWCSDVNLPGLSLNPIRYATPKFNVPIHGDKLEFTSLNITFNVDEYYKNWEEIYLWMRKLSGVKSLDPEYKDLRDNDKLYSTATLFLLTNKLNVARSIAFFGIHPISLSDVQLSTKDSNVPACSVTFEYEYYEMKGLNE